ncbi:N-acylneuraminate cytidylyltransferase A isoform X3 [Eurytemora carolleeae]|uniref:N-acylneuraminate cytidylyltransferase A isoform X3 n=1 Tax=Eurytemora carolleeae TaxID=1294199 RepID=UPI000C759A66|nr:N-acylneuraminate cytidylyltransferase A isoform X3 [Eurytemora carolleeae]|eukprot:XP_023344475.1 N-acylneuraminate cytidylyltransferase A-like isoform X3 [Eurytemora affinis]
MQEFGKFDSVWVSTDHSGISECAQALGAKVYNRCCEHAVDNSTSISAVQEFLKDHQEVDVLCLIQCTSPFIQPEFLDAGYKLLLKGYEAVFSVTRDKKYRWRAVDISKNESTSPLNFNPERRQRRQEMQVVLGEKQEMRGLKIKNTDNYCRL